MSHSKHSERSHFDGTPDAAPPPATTTTYVIITGGNAGLGFSTADSLLSTATPAQHRFHITLACRNEEKAKDAVRKLRDTHPLLADFVESMKLDLADLGSVKKFAEEYEGKGYPLHLLLNNGGIYPSSKTPVIIDVQAPNVSNVAVAEGSTPTKTTRLEQTFATNYLGHFYLTTLLLPLLKRTARERGKTTRIVNVSSELHRFAPSVDFTNLDYSKDPTAYSIRGSYATSKLAMMYETIFLAGWIPPLSPKMSDHPPINDAGVPAASPKGPPLVSINSCTPGFVPTTQMGNDNSRFNAFMSNHILTWLPFARTIEQGTRCIVLCATSPLTGEGSGHYMKDCKACEPAKTYWDDSKWGECWRWSCEACGLDPDETLEMVES
ncbi:uncharacterized protein EV422DRAFT_527503 [Fimicolochytrium jonesii]|uniref:uncharacterized protein n=1 Tax=Fimicolochytrium jonesii TaxID=1396493 RepID=UPI0022FEE139|nr:uncharacterized protein EV422DRAFT_527503 [Fimicolochytrium jonesii]KAI8821278.1 hypothetical protein EV422DRAFT_527503 [Fimicolochytrium jonesii]